MPWGCRTCGGSNPDGTRFCGHCGQPAEAAADPVPSLSRDDLQAQVAAVAGLIATPRSGVEERRLVTALFADVSGFTTLAHGVDEERLVTIIGPIVARMAEIVERYEGFVGKFAGDAILAFFGAPVAHEDDAVRAVLAARDMQAEMPELMATLGSEAHHLTLHIGVNTGYVVAGYFGGEVRMDYSILGDAVNVAQRLEAAAPGGAVYVGHDTYLLARDSFGFHDLGPLMVKGRPEPVQGWQLELDPRAAPGAGLGQPAAGDSPIVGRAAEVAVLDRMLAEVSAGRLGIAAVVGEPGVGKSRLLLEGRLAASRHGVRWVQTRCVAYRSRLPYWPLVELLRLLVGVDEGGDREAAARRLVEVTENAGVAAAAAYFLPIMGLPRPAGFTLDAPSDPMVFRHGLHDAVRGYLGSMLADTPLVLAVEDLHWADEGTVDLARMLAVGHDAGGFGLVLTTRPEGRGLVESVAGDAEHAVIDLSPLDRGGIRALAEEALAGTASETLVDVVAQRTSGNALFTLEVVRSLRDMDAVEPGPDGWQLRPGWNAEAVPVGVEKVLASRIDLLPRRAADVLQVASVMGRDVRLDLLREVVGAAGADLDATIELLVQGGFLDRVDEAGTPGLLFHHALLVDVAYGRLLRSRRRDIHRRVARVAADLYGEGDDVVDLLARHAYHGEMGVVAVEYLSRAAARAERLFANDDAVTYLGQALDILATSSEAGGEQRAELLLRQAGLEETRGALDRALSLYRDVLDIRSDQAALLGLASTLRKLGRYDESLAAVAEARAAQPPPTAEEVGALALVEAWVISIKGDVRGAADVLRSGLAALQGGHPLLQGQLLLMLARMHAFLGELDDASRCAVRARHLFEEEGDQRRMATALRTLGAALSDAAGDDPVALAEARDTVRQALAIARRVGDAEEQGAALINLGVVLADMGEADEALQCDREAIAVFARVGIKAGVANGLLNLCDKLIDQGRFAEAVEPAERARIVAEEIGHRIWANGAVSNLGRIALGLGDGERAAALALQAADGYSALGDRIRLGDALSTASRAYRLMGDDARAEELQQRAADAALDAASRAG
jgi:adenylate cyclase